MATITLTQPIVFPTLALRTNLLEYLPGYRWQCGEDDFGAEPQISQFVTSQMIMGRSAEMAVFTEVKPGVGILDRPAPDHDRFITIGDPTTDVTEDADRIVLAISITIMDLDRAGARFQRMPDGDWLIVDEVTELLSKVANGQALDAPMALSEAVMEEQIEAPDELDEAAPALRLCREPPATQFTPPSFGRRAVVEFGRKGL